MAKTDNLSDFLTDVANSIRTKTGTTEQINAQDFSDKILSISGLKELIAGKRSCDSLFTTYNGTSVDDLIQYSDTENVISMCGMFSACDNLTTIPLLNTGNVLVMNGMFEACRALTSIPQLNTSKVTDMISMFQNCSNLTTIPLLDTSNVKYMNYMFSGCHALTTVPALDASNVITMNYMFEFCWNLKSILMTNIGSNLNISASTLFERSDLLVILNNLKKTAPEVRTLTMGATNLAKLTEEDKAIATNKGWTLE